MTADAYRATVDEIAAHPVDLGVYRELHVRVSDLYHAHEITLEDASRLRSIINRAFSDRRHQVLTAPDEPKPTTREEVTTVSCSNPDCRKMGCPTPDDDTSSKGSK